MIRARGRVAHPQGTHPDVPTFKAALAAIRRRKRFVPRFASSAYADELLDLLDHLRSTIDDPRTGVELVAAFFRADTALLGTCDDSGGFVGDVFRVDARDLFTYYATECGEKKWLRGFVFKLLGTDGYGIRDSILATAAQWLPEIELRALADRLYATGRAARDAMRDPDEHDWSWRHWFLLVEMVARQLKDPRLFEQARRESWPDLSTSSYKDIATAWLDAGEPATALEWLERISPSEHFLSEERDSLLRTIYLQLGRRDDLERIAWKQFNTYRYRKSLEQLLDVIGIERRDDVIAAATDSILGAESFVPHDTAFLLDCGRTAEAAEHVMQHHAQVNGDYWSELVPLADWFVSAGKPLAATIIYRALLDSILERAKTPTYSHGVRYLVRLDRMAREITDWGDLSPHEAYARAVREKHGRKSSFWARYERR